MDISKIESGQMNIFIADVDINKCLEDSYLFFKHEAERKNIELKLTKVLNTNEIILKTDLDKLNSILFNLIKNAIDARLGKGELAVAITADAQKIKIDITDTGKGMAKSQFKKIFKPGFTTKKRGWGLGLSLSKRIIEDYHKGKIVVKNSEINKGTTFQIVLDKIS